VKNRLSFKAGDPFFRHLSSKGSGVMTIYPDSAEVAVAQNHLESALLKFGANPTAARQLLTGQLVANPVDREAIAKLIRHLLEYEEITLTFQRISWTADGGSKSGRDDWFN
jgi:hypothetical protein